MEEICRQTYHLWRPFELIPSSPVVNTNGLE